MNTFWNTTMLISHLFKCLPVHFFYFWLGSCYFVYVCVLTRDCGGCLLGSADAESIWGEVGQQLSKALVTTYFHFSDCLHDYICTIYSIYIWLRRCPIWKWPPAAMIKEKHTKWDYALENRMYIHNGVEDNKEDFLAILDCQKIC